VYRRQAMSWERQRPTSDMAGSLRKGIRQPCYRRGEVADEGGQGRGGDHEPKIAFIREWRCLAPD